MSISSGAVSTGPEYSHAVRSRRARGSGSSIRRCTSATATRCMHCPRASCGSPCMAATTTSRPGLFLWYTDGMQYMNHAATPMANIGLTTWPPLEPRPHRRAARHRGRRGAVRGLHLLGGRRACRRTTGSTGSTATTARGTTPSSARSRRSGRGLSRLGRPEQPVHRRDQVVVVDRLREDAGEAGGLAGVADLAAGVGCHSDDRRAGAAGRCGGSRRPRRIRRGAASAGPSGSAAAGGGR